MRLQAGLSFWRGEAEPAILISRLLSRMRGTYVASIRYSIRLDSHNAKNAIWSRNLYHS